MIGHIGTPPGPLKSNCRTHKRLIHGWCMLVTGIFALYLVLPSLLILIIALALTFQSPLISLTTKFPFSFFLLYHLFLRIFFYFPFLPLHFVISIIPPFRPCYYCYSFSVLWSHSFSMRHEMDHCVPTFCQFMLNIRRKIRNAHCQQYAYDGLFEDHRDRHSTDYMIN